MAGHAHSLPMAGRLPPGARLFLVFGWVAAACCARAMAQAEPARPSPRVALAAGVDVQGDLEAAERLIGKHQWELALPLLQRLMEGTGTHFIWDDGAFVPLRRLVSERISSLPAEAREAYGLLYEPSAEGLLRKGLAGRSLADLQTAAALYMNTPSGPRAASAAASLLMDEGDSGAALLALQETDVLPLEAELSGTVAAKKLLCLARLGRWEEAEGLLRDLAAAGVTGFQAGGRTWDARSFMDEAFSQFGPPQQPGRPTEPGAAQGGAAAAGLIPLTVDLPWPAKAAPVLPSVPSTQPVSDGKAVFVNRDGTVFAIEARTGRIRWLAGPTSFLFELPWGRSALDPAAEGPLPGFLPVAGLHHWRTFDNHGLARLSLAGDRLLAVQVDTRQLHFPDPLWEATVEQVGLTNELRCYDARTGALLWQVGGGARSAVPSLAGCWFLTAPAAYGGRAYALALRQGVLHALCLDTATAQPLWDSVLGPLESRQEVQRYCAELFLGDAPQPCVGDGVAVYPTGQGVVCAFDAHSGRPLWAGAYPRAARSINLLGQPLDVPAGPWTPTQPVIAGGLCVVAPSDSRYLVAFSLRRGQVAWQAEFPRGEALLGETSGQVFVQSQGITCLDLHTGRVLWHKPAEAPATGTGTLSGQRLYLPEWGGLRVLDAATGQTQAVLRAPAGSRLAGNALAVDGAVALATPDAVTLWLPEGDARAVTDMELPAGPNAYRALLLQGELSARLGDRPRAVERLGRAVEAAQSQGTPQDVALAKGRAALALGALALADADPALMGQSVELAGKEAAVRAELATLQLRLALGRQVSTGAAALYFDLCRDQGMTDRPGPFLTGSLWMELAGIVRQQCQEQPACSDAWAKQVQALLAQARSNGDEAALLAIARHAPFLDERVQALAHLADLWSAAGQFDRARLAFCEAALEAPEGSPAAAQAAAGMQRLPGSDWINVAAGKLLAGPPGQEAAPALTRTPTAPAAWSADGLLVASAGAQAPALTDRILVLEEQLLKCLDARDGSTVWQMPLPSVPQPARRLPEEAPATIYRMAPGYPLCCWNGVVELVALPRALMGIDASTGRLAWEQTFATPSGVLAMRQQVPRIEMVRRAVRGLPVPPGRSPSREIATDGFVCGLLTACRVVAYRDVSLVDPFTGQLREIVRGRGSSDLAGVLCAVQGSTACVLLERPDGPRVEAYDAKDGQLLARWRFPAGSIPNSISVVPPGALLVADSDAVHRISLSDPLPPVRWEIDEGVDRLLHADGELAVVRTMDGSAVCMDSRSGERLFSAQPGEGASTAWAARVGEAVYVLEATGLEGIVRHGPESHFLGTGFRFRALRLPGGAPLWSRELPGTGFQVAGPPLRVGRLWLLRSSEPGRLHVLAADAETGEQAFNLTLEGPESPEPFSLAAAAGGLVIGRQQEVLALAPSEEAVREQSGNAEVSAGAAPRPE